MLLVQPVLAPHTQFFIWLLLSTSPQLLAMFLLPRPMSNCSTLCLALYSAQCQWHFTHTSSFPCQSQSLSFFFFFSFFCLFSKWISPPICFLSFYVFVVSIIPWTLQISSVFSVPAFLPGLTVIILPSNFKPLHFIPFSILGCSQPSNV